MTVLMLLAAAAILAGVVAVAMGWGGELAPGGPDIPDRPIQMRTPHDVAMFRPPTGFFGYQMRPTSDALWYIAGVLAGRDAEIAQLRAELDRLAGTEPSAAAPAAALADDLPAADAATGT